MDHCILQIAAGALTLQERISLRHQIRFIPTDQARYEKYLETWRSKMGPEHPERLRSRLSFEGLGENDLPELLGKPVFDGPEDLPEWIFLFTEIEEFLQLFDFKANAGRVGEVFVSGLAEQVPFLCLTLPFAEFAMNRVRENTGDILIKRFSSEALRMLHSEIAQTLAMSLAHTLQLEFSVFRASRQSPLERLFLQSMPGNGKEDTHYQQFCRQIHPDGWKGMFSEYPVLARILTIRISHWIKNSTEFLQRLDSDLPLISERFAGGRDPGLVKCYRGGLSDAHNQGRSVISLTFESGLRLIYKPKELALEEAWSAFLAWFNFHGFRPALKAPEVIRCNGYGWVEFIENGECHSEEEVKSYYRRIGAFTAIIYLLNGNDFHMENLIAAGEHPVLVDLESVMHHESKQFMDDGTGTFLSPAVEQLQSSVLRTGLLPMWSESRGGQAFDVSGIGSFGQGEIPFMAPYWENINTDQMKVSSGKSSFRAMNNLPVYEGKTIRFSGYTSDIIAGFSDLYRFVQERKSEIPVALFRGQELRFIFRATKIYSLIMQKSAMPELLRDGLNWSFQTEQLCRAFLSSPGAEPYWAVGRSELLQICNLDVPIFHAFSDRTDLHSPMGHVCNNIVRSRVFDMVIRRLANLDEAGLKLQLKYIHGALQLRNMVHAEVAVLGEEGGDQSHPPLPGPGELVREAINMAGLLEKEAIRGINGSCTWVTAGLIPGSDKYRVQPLSVFLYEGVSGVALFLSALSSVTTDQRVHELTRASLLSVRTRISLYEHGTDVPDYIPIGIGTGMASVIYSLLKISGFLNDPSLIDDALLVSRRISPGMIANDRAFDILSGSAGCILALLLLYQKTNQPDCLAKAILCGDHLLKNISQNPDGTSGWKTYSDKMLTGFSHGQAGIAHALLKLSDISGVAAYREAALQALICENTRYHPEAGNWEDLRMVDQNREASPQFMTSWCHGAPGIGLSRQAISASISELSLADDIEAAIATTAAFPVAGRDHLCCGNMGRVDILLRHALKTGDHQLKEVALRNAGIVVEKAKKAGHYRLLTDSGAFLIPDFFQGISGIGYQLLRLAYPEKFPSVLAFE